MLRMGPKIKCLPRLIPNSYKYLFTFTQKFHQKYLNNFSMPWITLEVSLYEAHDFKGSNLVMSWGPSPKNLIMTDRNQARRSCRKVLNSGLRGAISTTNSFDGTKLSKIRPKLGVASKYPFPCPHASILYLTTKYFSNLVQNLWKFWWNKEFGDYFF